jgi:SnoaL-like protein
MVNDVKTAAGLAMTRRVAVTGGVLVGVSGFAMPGGSAQMTAGAAPVARALTDRLQGTLGGSDLEKLADLMHPAVRTIAWSGSTELDLVGPSAYLASYLTPYLRENPQFRMTVTKVLSNGIELIAFYDVSALVDGKTSVWSGCNVYLTDGERIVEQWIQQDLWWRSRSSPTVNSRVVMEQIERNFKEKTTAANLAGMGLLMCYKNTMMQAAQRIGVLIPLLASDAVQTFWKPEGIALFADPHAIEVNFAQTVLTTTLNFWETVRRVVIVGNAIALLQAPSEP